MFETNGSAIDLPSGTMSFAFNGGTGADTLSLDFSNGVPADLNTITYTGGTGGIGSGLTVINDQGATVYYNPAGNGAPPYSGSVMVSGSGGASSVNIAFSNLTPVDLFGGDQVFELSNAPGSTGILVQKGMNLIDDIRGRALLWHAVGRGYFAERWGYL